MSTKANTINKAIQLSPSDYRKMISFDRRVERKNTVSHAKLALGIVELVAQNPRAEWDIVSKWLERQGRVAVLKTDLKSFRK
jgi:hypothetical protein